MHSHHASLAWIDTQRDAMVERTLAWSRINSGSGNIAGLAAMLAALKEAFAPLGGEMEEIELLPRDVINSKGEIARMPLGKALRIRKHARAPLQVFLGGHMDTVFAVDHPFQEPVFLDENTLNGPGVADLKGGLSVMLTVLQALEMSEHAGALGWEVLINPDEEIGSPGSDALLKEAAGRNHLGLVYEPSMEDGTLAGSRKGSGNYTLVVHGRAAHVGRAFQEGRNAIALIAELILQLTALMEEMPGITVNPGHIEGGGPVNMVPELAILRFNIRVETKEQQAGVEGRLARIVAQANMRDGFRVTLHGGFSRPPKQVSAPLFALLEECGEALSIPIRHIPTGGCCDGNNLAAYGLANIDTLGVRGGALHSAREYMKIDSLTERAKLSALLLLKLASGEAVWPTRS